MVTLAGETVPNGEISVTPSFAVYDVIVSTQLGAFSPVLLAKCIPGQALSCSDGVSTYTGTCDRLELNNGIYRCYIKNCTMG